MNIVLWNRKVFSHKKSVIRKNFKRIRIVISLVLALSYLMFFSSCQGNLNEIPREQVPKLNKATICFFPKDGVNSIAVGKTLLDSTIKGEILSTQRNFEGTRVALLSSYHTLYLVTTTEAIKVAENIQRFYLSSTGSGIAYIDEKGTLNLYSCDERSHMKVADDITSQYVTISPDGKTVLYNVDLGGGNEEAELFLFTNGTSVSIGKNLFGIAVSNDGNYIYSFERENEHRRSLYFSSVGETPIQLAEGIEEENALCFLNQDLSQILFQSNGKHYIAVNGKEKQEIDYHETEQEKESRFWYPIEHRNHSLLYQTDTNCYFSSLISFYDQLFTNNTAKGLAMLEHDGNVRRKMEGASHFFLNENGDTLLYLKSGTLYKTPVDDFSNPEVLANKVSDYCASADGETIYYMDSVGVLWGKVGQSPANMITAYASSYAITDEGTLFFLSYRSSENNTLFACKDGKEAVKIADDVNSFAVYGDVVYYDMFCESTKKYDIYCCEKNTEFSRLIQERDRGLFS